MAAPTLPLSEIRNPTSGSIPYSTADLREKLLVYFSHIMLLQCVAKVENNQFIKDTSIIMGIIRI